MPRPVNPIPNTMTVSELASKGGHARAKTLAARRRSKIAAMGGRAKRRNWLKAQAATSVAQKGAK